MIPFSQEKISEYTAKGWWGTKTLYDYLAEHAAANPDKEVLVDVRQARWTLSRLKEQVDRNTAALFALGVRKDDFVVLQVPNWAEFVALHLALTRLGAVTVPVVMPFRQHELDYILTLSDAVMAIFPSQYGGFSYLDMYQELRQEHPCLKHLVSEGKDLPAGVTELSSLFADAGPTSQLDEYLKINAPTANDVITMCLTSGTESVLKGVPRTHNNWITMVQVLAVETLLRTPDDVALVPVPLPNLFGLVGGLYPSIVLGHKIVLLDRFEPEVALRTIDSEGITTYMGVPAMHISLLNFPERDKYRTSSLRCILSGGAPAPASMIRRLQNEFGVWVANGFGSNEGTFIGTRPEQSPESISETIGPAPRTYEIKVINEEGRVLPPGETGELAFRGPCIFPGYYKRDDLNAKAFDADGFFHSGDSGWLGFDGYYRFAGRIKDIIIRGGQNISPEEVEDLLQQHPKVLFAAVVAMPDERLGERSVAYVQLKEGTADLTLEEVRRFLDEKGLAKYKYPERVELWPELPRTPTGKVQKFILRKDIAQKLSAGG